MNILLLDQDNSIAQLLEYYTTFEKDWSFTIISNYNDYLHESDNKEIDLLIVDSLNKTYDELLRDILGNDLTKKTIIISEQLKSSVQEGCDFCIKHYKRRRLIKPVEPKELYDLIKNFDKYLCPFIDSFNKIENIIPNIIKRFSCLSYNSNLKVINGNERCPSNQYTHQFVSVISLLEQNNVKYSVLDEYNIQLQIS